MDLISIKEYAESRHKSVQAVYGQLKAKSNVEALAGHVITKKENGRDTRYLDAEAIRVLDESATHNMAVISIATEETKELRLANEQLKVEKEQLLEKLLQKNEEVQQKQEKIIELQEQIIEMQRKAAEPDAPERKWWQRFFTKGE